MDNSIRRIEKCLKTVRYKEREALRPSIKEVERGGGVKEGSVKYFMINTVYPVMMLGSSSNLARMRCVNTLTLAGM